MSPLAEIQFRLRQAVVTGDTTGVVPVLVGGRDALKRLDIHRRHYETSLVTALLGKFPATVWLVGSLFVTEAARHFIREHPPLAPCIAEYGAEFPAFLSTRPASERVPYLREFAELERCLGQVAIAIDQRAASLEDFSKLDAAALPNAVLTLQGGLRYLHASWPVDDLMRLYLTEAAPSRFALSPVDVWIEVRGARGRFLIGRLDASEFVFRRSVLDGRSIGDAAGCALDVDAAFDAGRAFATLVTDGLVTAIATGIMEGSE